MAISRWRGCSRVTSRGPINIRPLVGSSRPARRRSAVVLPQPDGPSMTRKQPSGACRSRSISASAAPTRLQTSPHPTPTPHPPPPPPPPAPPRPPTPPPPPPPPPPPTPPP